MRGQHELDRDALGRGRDLPGAHTLAVEQLERLVERLAQRAALALDLAATANTVVLLGDVREVEVDGERPQHDRLRVDVELRDGLTERPGRARVAATPEPGEEADPLLEAEDVVALLLVSTRPRISPSRRTFARSARSCA